MKNCLLSAVVVLVLAIHSCASSRAQQSNSFRFIDNGQEKKALANPIRFPDDFKERGFTETDSSDSESALVGITFDDENFYQNERDINDKHNDESHRKSQSRIKIKFEGNDDDKNDDQGESGDDDDSSQDSGDEEYEEESSSKPVKFEGNDDTIKSGSEKKTKSKRVVFEKQKAWKKKTKPARERRLHNIEKPAPMAMNSPYPGLGYYGYPGSGYLGAGLPTTGDPKPIYPGYAAGYPAYPYTYPTSYPGMANPTQSYPGYAQYPGSTYPAVTSGYMAYPTPGYQNPVGTRPANPVAYPGPANIDQEFPSGPGPAHTVPNKPNAYQNSGYAGSYYLSYPTASAGYQPGHPGDPSVRYPVPGYPTAYPPGTSGTYTRPSRRPKSLTQRAVSAVAEALTSIALYDDYQCVPRMLCEVAGGSTASSPALQKATAGLQPLLGLLQTFDAASASPLLVFGRAAVLGVTSKNNPKACSKAYPQCPNDPEKLIYYLNNHNGGFFRFFGQPELSHQQHNLEQFYGYLSGQYGLLQPQGQPNNPNVGYGLLPQNTNPPNYGANYREQLNYRDTKEIKINAEERIQNKPHVNALDDVSFDDDEGPKWAFPENDKRRDKIHVFRKEPERAIRDSNSLKFPEDRPKDKIRDQYQTIHRPVDYVRTQKKVFFPEGNDYQTEESNNNYYINNQRPVEVNLDDYVFDYNNNIFVERPKAVRQSDVTTLYVVRGNGDPNHPEIVKVRPGQSV